MSSDPELQKQMEEAVRREGIDLIGFAPKSRFDDVPDMLALIRDGMTMDFAFCLFHLLQ